MDMTSLDGGLLPTPAREDTLLGVACTFISLTWIVVSLRFWVRSSLIKSFGTDDWAMVITQVIYTGYCSMMILISTDRATGLEIQSNLLGILDKIMGYTIAAMGLYILAMTALKIALGLFFLRIVIRQWQRWTVWITVGVSTVYGMAYFFIAVFQCGDPSKFFQYQLEGKCMKIGPLAGINYTAGALNALTDVILAVLPIFILHKAQMPLPAKISAGCILAMGGVGAVISMIRLKYIWGLAPGPAFFVNAIDISIWSVIEPGIGITAASLATLRPMFRCCMANARTAFSSQHSEAKKVSDGTSETSSRGHNGRQSPGPHAGLDFQDRGLAPEPQSQWNVRTTVIGNARVMEKMGVARENVRQQPPTKTEATFEQVPSTASRRMHRLSASISNLGSSASRQRAPSILTRTPSQRPLVANEQGVKMARLKRRDDGKFEVVNPTANDREGDWL